MNCCRYIVGIRTTGRKSRKKNRRKKMFFSSLCDDKFLMEFWEKEEEKKGSNRRNTFVLDLSMSHILRKFCAKWNYSFF